MVASTAGSILGMGWPLFEKGFGCRQKMMHRLSVALAEISHLCQGHLVLVIPAEALAYCPASLPASSSVGLREHPAHLEVAVQTGIQVFRPLVVLSSQRVEAK